MCGFGGVFPLKEDELYFKRDVFNRFHKNRGGTSPTRPSFQGNSFIKDLFLSYTRLSVLSTHNPPYFSKCNNFCGMFNGEIFNYQSLSKIFNKDNPVQSELAVLVEMYAKKGPQSLKNLEGQFCGVIYDLKRNHITLFRDRLGLTPLYYSLSRNRIIFSSYQRPIIEINGKTGINKWAKDSIILTGYNIFNESLFKGIFEVLPGEFIIFDINKKKTIGRYHQIEKLVSENTSPDHKDLEEYLKKSLETRIPEIDFSLFLSSGIDSTLTAILMKEKGIVPAATITLDSTKQYSELPHMKETLKFLNYKNPEVITLSHNSFIEKMKHIIEIEEEPHGDISFFSLWELAEKINSQNHIVTFSGDFSDELFLGYEDLTFFLVSKGYSFSEYLKDSKKTRLFIEEYIRHYLIKTDIETASSLFKLEYSIEDFISYTTEYLLMTLHIDYDITIGKLCILLNIYLLYLKNNSIKADRTSMENGFEIRSIFHYYPLIEYVFSLKSSELFIPDKQKSLLVDIINERYPIVFGKKKMPTVPFSNWLTDAPDKFYSVFKKKDMESQFLNYSSINNVLKIHKKNNRNMFRELRLFYVLSLFEGLTTRKALC
ncbi:hypothetical protein KAJ27_08460 [bacterium]|nr:hypothetical protein [bacterium]